LSLSVSQKFHSPRFRLFLQGLQDLHLPVRHGEAVARRVPPDLAVVLRVERRDLVAHHAPHGLDQRPHAVRHAQIHLAPPLGSRPPRR
jgi:hypothetical protein